MTESQAIVNRLLNNELSLEEAVEEGIFSAIGGAIRGVGAELAKGVARRGTQKLTYMGMGVINKIGKAGDFISGGSDRIGNSSGTLYGIGRKLSDVASNERIKTITAHNTSMQKRAPHGASWDSEGQGYYAKGSTQAPSQEDPKPTPKTTRPKRTTAKPKAAKRGAAPRNNDGSVDLSAIAKEARTKRQSNRHPSLAQAAGDVFKSKSKSKTKATNENWRDIYNNFHANMNILNSNPDNLSTM